MDQYTDQEIVDGLESGENVENLITFLYRKHREALIHYLLGKQYVKHRPEAEDAIQESFILLVRRIQNGGFDTQRSRIKTYLYRIAINWVLDQHKDEKKRKQAEDDFRNLDGEVEELRLEEESVWANLREESAWSKFMKLGEKCKILLRMVAEGYEYAEIQRALGYETQGNVRIKKMRCLQKLAKL